MTKPFKKCSCGRTFSLTQWFELQLVAANWERIQMRNCECGSTIAVRLSMLPAVMPAQVSL